MNEQWKSRITIEPGRRSMRAVSFLGWCLFTLCLACNGGEARDRAYVDLTDPGKQCEAHGVPLQEGIVPITYGLFRPTVEEEEAQEKLFPHARSFYNPGCVVKKPKRARVSFCPECRKAERTWKEAQARTMAPIEAHWERVCELVQNNPKFEEVHPFIRRGNAPTVGIEGRVKSDEDLAELRRRVGATVPPQPVYWSVRVGP